jgi:hypothetical protein
MSNDEQAATLEERVRELQTAVATIVGHLGLEHDVNAAERARLDEIKAKGDFPSEHLSEIYDKQQHS